MFNPFDRFRRQDYVNTSPGMPGPVPTGSGIWFTFDNGGAGWLQQDFAGGNRNIATATGTPNYTGGLTNAGVSFTTGTYYRTIGAGPYLAKNWTISAWVTLTSGALAGTNIILCRGSNTQRSYCLQVDQTTGTLTVAFTTALNTFKTATSATGLSTVRWYHVAGSYDGVNLRVYIDGVQSAAVAETGTPQDISTVGVGTFGAAVTTSPLFGNLFDVRVFDRALERAEVNALYNAQWALGTFEYTCDMLPAQTSPPPKPGKGGGKPDEPPGKPKKDAAYLASARRFRFNQKRLMSASTSLALLPAQYLSPTAKTFFGVFEKRRRVRREKHTRMVRQQQNASIASAVISILPQEYVPPGYIGTVWRDVVKHKTLRD